MALTGLWALSGAHFFWPAIPLFFLVLSVFKHARWRRWAAGGRSAVGAQALGERARAVGGGLGQARLELRQADGSGASHTAWRPADDERLDGMYRTELKGRVAVVLGGADGVGAAVCRLLAARGARIAVIGDDEAELQDLVDELRWVGADAVGIVSTGVDAGSVHAGVLSEVGPPDLLFVLPGHAECRRRLPE